MDRPLELMGRRVFQKKLIHGSVHSLLQFESFYFISNLPSHLELRGGCSLVKQWGKWVCSNHSIGSVGNFVSFIRGFKMFIFVLLIKYFSRVAFDFLKEMAPAMCFGHIEWTGRWN